VSVVEAAVMKPTVEATVKTAAVKTAAMTTTAMATAAMTTATVTDFVGVGIERANAAELNGWRIGLIEAEPYGVVSSNG
jgi:hypothetical protein